MASDVQTGGPQHSCTPPPKAGQSEAQPASRSSAQAAVFVFPPSDEDNITASETTETQCGRKTSPGASDTAAASPSAEISACPFSREDPTDADLSSLSFDVVRPSLLSSSRVILPFIWGERETTFSSLFASFLASVGFRSCADRTTTASPPRDRLSLHGFLRSISSYISSPTFSALEASAASSEDSDFSSLQRLLFALHSSRGLDDTWIIPCLGSGLFSPAAATAATMATAAAAATAAAEASAAAEATAAATATAAAAAYSCGDARGAALRAPGGPNAKSNAAAVFRSKRLLNRPLQSTPLLLFSLPLLFLLSLLCTFSLLPSGGETKKVLGLARDNKYQPIAEFCFTIPPGEHGRVVAQTVVNVPGHELIILNRTEHRALLAAAAEEAKKKQQERFDGIVRTEGNSSSSSSHNTSADPICEQLLRAARVREPLRDGAPLQFQSDLPSLFELDLVVDPKLNGHPVSAWLTRCKSSQPLDAMYSIQFINPGSIWEQHFSCDEQGLLQLYLVVLIFCGLGTAFWWAAAWRAAFSSLPSSAAAGQWGRSSRPASGAAAAARSVSVAAGSSSACGLLSLAVLLFTIHLIIYAGNGWGVIVLKFLSQFFEACGRCVLCCIFGALAARGCAASTASFASAAAAPPPSSATVAAVAAPLHLSLHRPHASSLAPGAVIAYIALQLFNLVAEYSLPVSTQICAYPLFRTGWGVPSVLGSALVAGLLLLEAVPHLATAVSLQDGPLLRYRLLLAAGTTTYFLVPLLLLLFSPPSQVRDSFVLLASELTAAAILFRVSSRGGPGSSSSFGATAAAKVAGDTHPYIDL